jgi:hypothetical protein
VADLTGDEARSGRAMSETGVAGVEVGGAGEHEGDCEYSGAGEGAAASILGSGVRGGRYMCSSCSPVEAMEVLLCRGERDGGVTASPAGCGGGTCMPAAAGEEAGLDSCRTAYADFGARTGVSPTCGVREALRDEVALRASDGRALLRRSFCTSTRGDVDPGRAERTPEKE